MAFSSSRSRLCSCGHPLSRHNSAGCWVPGCNCSRKGSKGSSKKKGSAWW